MNYAILLLSATLLTAGIYFTTMIRCWVTDQYEKVKWATPLLMPATIYFSFVIFCRMILMLEYVTLLYYSQSWYHLGQLFSIWIGLAFNSSSTTRQRVRLYKERIRNSSYELSQIPHVHYKGMYEFAELNVKISHTRLMFECCILSLRSGEENPCVSKTLQLLTLHSNSFKSALLWWHPSSQGCCEEHLCGREWGRTLFTGTLQSLADHERGISSINIVLCAVLCSFSYLKQWFIFCPS